MLPPCSVWQQNIDTIQAELSQFQTGIPGIEVECHQTFQRIPGLCPIHSMYGQQSTDIHADNTKFGHAMGHHWVGALTSYEFTLEYQKGSDNATTDMLS